MTLYRYINNPPLATHPPLEVASKSHTPALTAGVSFLVSPIFLSELP
jgi:hypothetical protein